MNNMIKCRKCGAPVISIESRFDDLRQHAQEIEAELIKIRGIKKYKPRVTELNIRAAEIKKLLGKEKRVMNFQRSIVHDTLLLECLKKYVDRKTFLKAVEESKALEHENQLKLDAELKRVFGNSSGLTSHYKDSTADAAINNASKY